MQAHIASLSDRIKTFNAAFLPDKVQLKYKFLAENIYRFYRGTCHIFYEDLSHAQPLPDSPLAWICGDLHLENFGSYKGDNRLVYFDLNDFDEAVLAPATWELVRMVTSIFIAFDQLKIENEKAYRMAELFLKTYSLSLAMGRVKYIEPRTAKGIVKSFLGAVEKRKQKDLLKKRTGKIKKKLVLIVNGKKHVAIDKVLKNELKAHITNWLKNNEECPYNYKVLDVAFRLAGTGSMGLKRYIILLQSLKDEKDHLLLDMKQSKPSSLDPFIKVAQPQWLSHAKRITGIQVRMQNVPPALLSTTIFKGDPYVIEEMQPIEDNINFNLIKNNYRDVYQVIDDMAMLTASSQLRSCGRDGSAIADDMIAFGKNEEWQKAIIDYAKIYAGTLEKYYAEFVTEYNKGTFKNPVKVVE